MLLWATGVAYGQTDTLFLKKTMPYGQYIDRVGKHNIAYAAEKFNIPVAAANIEAAKIFPDPELSAGWFDNGQRRLNMGNGYSAGIGWTVELGGKRKARIDLAKSESELAGYLLQDYFRNLRAEATLKYLEAIRNGQLVQVQFQAYDAMNRLAQSDSIRAHSGAISDLDARQSRLEAATMRNDVYQAIADWKTSLSELAVFTGTLTSDTLMVASGNFTPFDRNFELARLVSDARQYRADLAAALQDKTVAEKMLALAKASRVIDLGLSAGLTYASYVRNAIAPTPSFVQTNLGLSIPLKFSNNNRGALKTAYYTTLQTEARYQQAALQVQAEVTQAFFNYQATRQQALQFNTGLLAGAQIILEGKLYSYRRGETSLLEVLNAQRTYNEVQQNYYQTLFNCAAALVALEKAAGIWDINF
ncbi:TolC family protein [Taibaiella chishuiensis]|nr:TolC family protein [Taibaiella chishuiensis]